MTESESVALPLGDAAIVYFVFFVVRLALSTVFSISKEKQFVNTFFEKNSNFFKKLFYVSKKYIFVLFASCFLRKTCKSGSLMIKLSREVMK